MAMFSWPAIIAQYVAMWDEARQVAETCDLPTGPTMHYPMAFSQAYRHYPSQWLDDALQVQTAPANGEIDLESPYVTMQHLLQQPLLQDLLRLGAAGTTVGELITATGQDP